MAASSSTGTSRKSFAEVRKQKIAGISRIYRLLVEREKAAVDSDTAVKGLSARQILNRLKRRYGDEEQRNAHDIGARMTDLNKSNLVWTDGTMKDPITGRSVQLWRTCSGDDIANRMILGVTGHHAYATNAKMVRIAYEMTFTRLGKQARAGLSPAARDYIQGFINEAALQYAKTLTPEQIAVHAEDPRKFKRLACKDYMRRSTGGHKPLPVETYNRCLTIRRSVGLD